MTGPSSAGLSRLGEIFPCCAHREAYKLDTDYAIPFQSQPSPGVEGVAQNAFIIPIVRGAATIK